MDKQQWLDFLNEKTHTDKEWQQAHKSANSWGCCAIGSLILNDPINPMLKKNRKCIKTLNKIIINMISSEVQELGMNFYFAIEQKNIPLAKQLFNRIHELKVKKAL